MAIYIAAYDLKKPGQNYEPLWDLLRKLKAVRALESTWFLESTLGASQIKDAMKTVVDANDRLLVVEITNDADWATRLLIAPSADWLTARRP